MFQSYKVTYTKKILSSQKFQPQTIREMVVITHDNSFDYIKRWFHNNFNNMEIKHIQSLDDIQYILPNVCSEIMRQDKDYANFLDGKRQEEQIKKNLEYSNRPYNLIEEDNKKVKWWQWKK